MPKWGLTMTEGKIVGWLKQPGQIFAEGEERLENAGDFNRLLIDFFKRTRNGYGSRRDEHRAAGDR